MGSYPRVLHRWRRRGLAILCESYLPVVLPPLKILLIFDTPEVHPSSSLVRPRQYVLTSPSHHSLTHSLTNQPPPTSTYSDNNRRLRRDHPTLLPRAPPHRPAPHLRPPPHRAPLLRPRPRVRASLGGDEPRRRRRRGRRVGAAHPERFCC